MQNRMESNMENEMETDESRSVVEVLWGERPRFLE